MAYQKSKMTKCLIWLEAWSKRVAGKIVLQQHPPLLPHWYGGAGIIGAVMDKRSVPPSSPAPCPAHAGHAAPARDSRRRHRAWFALTFSVLCLVALGLRLQSAWHRNHASPDDLVVRLDGDEPHYEALAYGLLQGAFFPSPLRG